MASMTTLGLSGYPLKSFWKKDCEIFAHSSWRNASYSHKFDGDGLCNATFNFSHLFSIELRSGFELGHPRTFILTSLNHSWFVLALRLGSSSCWKTKWHPIFNFLADFIRFSIKILQYIALFIIPLSGMQNQAWNHIEGTAVCGWDCRCKSSWVYYISNISQIYPVL